MACVFRVSPVQVPRRRCHVCRQSARRCGRSGRKAYLGWANTDVPRGHEKPKKPAYHQTVLAALVACFSNRLKLDPRPTKGSCRLSRRSFAGVISKFFCGLQGDKGLIAPAPSLLARPCHIEAQTASTPIGSVNPSQFSTLIVAEGTTQAAGTLLIVTHQPCRCPEFYLLLH
jgi:hypothetical protein